MARKSKASGSLLKATVCMSSTAMVIVIVMVEVEALRIEQAMKLSGDEKDEKEEKEMKKKTE